MIRNFGNVQGLKSQPRGLLLGLSSGDAVASDLLSGKTANTDAGDIVGTMPNLTGDSVALASSVSGTTLKLRPPTGFKDGVDDNVTITDPNFVNTKILINNSIFGLAGTAIDGSILNAGNILWVSADLVQQQNGATFVKKKEILVNKAGTVRVKFDLAYNYTDAYEGIGQIFVNGVARGTLRSNTSQTYVTFTEDITVNANDLIQVYAKTTSASFYAQIKNFRLYQVVAPNVATINLD